MTKSLLVLGVIGVGLGMVFNSGLVNVENSAIYVALPLGAIFLGLALISKLLEKESAVYDQEQRTALAAAARVQKTRTPERSCCCQDHDIEDAVPAGAGKH